MRQTDYVVLGLLHEAPLTGYQIKKIIDHRFSFFWNESYGQLYPALKSLCERGLISIMPSTETQKHRQKAYSITPQGMAALKDWLTQPIERETVRLGILLKMYFSDLAPDAVILEHLAQFQAAHEKDLQTLLGYQQELLPIVRQHANHERVLQVIDFGVKTNQAYLQWCDETISILKEGKPK